MKKSLCLWAVAALIAAPLIVGAAQWTISSDPFGFPTSVVQFDKPVSQARAALTYKPGLSKGFITFQYSLPEGAGSARLSIYNLSGVRMVSFDLPAGSSSQVWSFGNRRIAPGIYLATMRCGSLETMIQVSIVK
jgi:hypothetical protein